MAVAVDLKKIEDWFIRVQGWKVVQASSDEMGNPKCIEDVLGLTLEDVKAFAQARCEWVEIEDMSDTPYAQEGFMHPESLEIGWGKQIDAYRNKEGAGVYFFNAYNPN